MVHSVVSLQRSTDLAGLRESAALLHFEMGKKKETLLCVGRRKDMWAEMDRRNGEHLAYINTFMTPK